MSVRVMSWVWEKSRAEGIDRLVLLAIADCASDDGGSAWPSIGKLYTKTGLHQRTVQRSIFRLVNLGELEVQANAGPKGCNRYRILMTPGRESPPAERHPGRTPPRRKVAPPPAQSRPTPGTAPPEPSLNRPEPSNRGRERQQLFSAVASACGIDTSELTRSLRGELNAATRDISAAGGSPEDVPKRAGQYRRKMPNATMSPSALAKWWSTLGNGTRSARPCPTHGTSEACVETPVGWNCMSRVGRRPL